METMKKNVFLKLLLAIYSLLLLAEIMLFKLKQVSLTSLLIFGAAYICFIIYFYVTLKTRSAGTNHH